jgi:hypothetical protein
MSGMTLKSVCTAILGVLIVAILTQFFSVFAAAGGALYGSEALSLTALDTFAVLALISGAVFLATRVRIFSGAEMLFILYVLLIAAPLCNTAFWRYMIGANENVIREQDWGNYDNLSPALWPHGADLIGNKLEDPQAATTTGTVQWEKHDVNPTTHRNMPVMQNTGDDQVSAVRFRLPLMEKDQVLLPLDEPYMMTIRVSAQDLHAQSRYFARLYYDDSTVPDLEVISAFDAKKISYLEPEGFFRQGAYGFTIPSGIKDHVTVEVGLKGAGKIEVSDVNFFNVFALEGCYSGRHLATREVYDTLSPPDRAGLVVLPATMFSLEGLKFLICGYVPWSDWWGPITLWGGFIGLMLVASLAFACLMRRQWVDNERFPLPLTQAPITLSGLDTRLRDGVSYLRNPYLWIGFIVMLLWALSGSLVVYFPALPHLGINIPLKPYLSDPGWGKMWETTFVFRGFYFSLGLLMEIHVLFSFVLGYFLFRAQYWLGEAKGLNVDSNYPYAVDQQIGSIVSYALMTLWIARRFFGETIRSALKGEKSDEVITPRYSYLTMAGSLVGIVLLGMWAGFNPLGMAVLAVCLFLAMIVAMKLRAECGYPGTGFLDSIGGATLLPLFTFLGSFAVFTPATAIFMGTLSVILFVSSTFLLLPGLQMEFVALGHRVQMRRTDILFAIGLGIVGGIAIGGWVYLSGAYAVGANNYPVPGNFGGLNKSVSHVADAATTALDKMKGNPVPSTLFDKVHLAFYFGIGVTVVLSVVRQLFAGFWFHPLGYVLGGSQLMQDAWGSLLVALVVRYAVLKLGGAATVREKLIPFAIGCIMGVIGTSIITSIFAAHGYFFVPGGPKPWGVY